MRNIIIWQPLYPVVGEGLSMSSPNYPVLCCPLPYRVAPVFVQVVSPPLCWSPLSSFLVIWSPCGDARHHLRNIHLPKLSHDLLYCLFFVWFPLCRGEAGLLVTPKYSHFCNFFPLLPVVGIFSPLFFLLCLSQISLHAVLPS